MRDLGIENDEPDDVPADKSSDNKEPSLDDITGFPKEYR